jgi:hypothetical protein
MSAQLRRHFELTGSGLENRYGGVDRLVTAGPRLSRMVTSAGEVNITG